MKSLNRQFNFAFNLFWMVSFPSVTINNHRQTTHHPSNYQEDNHSQQPSTNGMLGKYPQAVIKRGNWGLTQKMTPKRNQEQGREREREKILLNFSLPRSYNLSCKKYSMNFGIWNFSQKSPFHFSPRSQETIASILECRISTIRSQQNAPSPR